MMVPAWRIVDPIFKVVLIPSLVVQPCAAVPLFPAFSVVGAAVALIIFRPHQEFRRGILGEVMGQPLPIKPDPEAVPHDQQFVAGDRFQMRIPFIHCGCQPSIGSS